MRIGIVCCSGGGTFLAARDAMLSLGADAPTFHVVTDRPCGVEAKCAEQGISHTRLEQNDIDRFSAEAARLLVDEQGVDFVLLFFHRVVTQALWGRVPTMNLHPSLLPAYQGFSPLKRALAGGVKHFGATLHLATDAVDAGPIVAQVCQSMPEDATLELLNRMSFLQKTCLVMLCCEAHETGKLTVDLQAKTAKIAPPHRTGRCLSPSFSTDRYRQAFLSLQATHNIEGLVID